MPELPEVELVARSLERFVSGRVVASAKLIRAGLAPANTPREFARVLRGAKITGVGRRGKFILINFDKGRVLLTHLRMTGRFALLGEGRPLPAHTHALFRLEGGGRLAFTDQRHFGFMRLARADELESLGEIRKLAPEPFSEGFTADYLAGVLERSRRRLKEVLLDQTKVTGLGNIYAAESLFLARANPLAFASGLSRRRVARLHAAIQKVLGEATAQGAKAKVDPENIDGSYFDGDEEGRWRVYDREGRPCPACRARIVRVTQAGRSSYFCPRCQRV